MATSLFSEFEAASKERWKQQAIKDLKGKDFDTTLIWHTSEGIDIEPYYSAEDLTTISLADIQAAQTATKATTTGVWQNREEVVYQSEKETNIRLAQALAGGANAVSVNFGSTDLQTINIQKLLEGIKLSEVPVTFQVADQSSSLVQALAKFIGYQMKGGIADDAVARYAQTGTLAENYWNNLVEILNQTADSTQFRVIRISSEVFHNAGATAVQELACVLASGLTYLDELTNRGKSIDEITPKIEFSIAVGTNYFVEVAKLRALRYLWRKILGGYGATQTQTYIHATTSLFFDAAITPNTNMLRATTEAMSAIIGGCDALSTHAYDAAFRPETAFSARIARNVSTVLKEESYLDKALDPSAGSYYIEYLTDAIATQAWSLLQQIEEQGGLLKALTQNTIQDVIEQSFEKRQQLLQENKAVMVGVNKFRVDEEPLNLQPVAEAPVATFKLLQAKRLAGIFEN